MIKIPVYLRDMCDAKHLVQAASGCEKNVDLICGRYNTGKFKAYQRIKNGGKNHAVKKSGNEKTCTGA